ncbi:MAG: hypothetical protein IT545_16685 [Rhodobacteraceae bacterium]|nr:hypothetical protein [Paracoccaceae bacterium]
MSGAGRLVAAVLLALAALLVPVPAGAEVQTLTLTVGQSREFARRALAAGRAEVARAIALALLEADPRDHEALTLLAAAQARAGETGAARATARLAFRRAASRDERYEAARVAALVADAAGRPFRAQGWLRRALTLAPAEADRADTIAHYRAVQSANRWSTTFRAHVAPSSNVNRGSRYDQLIIDGIPTPFVLSGDAQALSGVEFGVSAGAAYRLSQGPDWRLEAGGRLHHTTYVLSAAARHRAPDVSGADFANGGAEVSLRLTVLPRGGTSPVSLGLTLGQSWYGEEPLARTMRLDVGRSFTLTPATGLRLDLLAERQWSDRGRKARALILAAQAQLHHRLAGGDMLRFRLTLTDLRSEDVNAANLGVAGELRWELARPLGPAELALAVSGSARDYPVFMSNIFNKNGREEKQLGVAVEMAFPGGEVWGYMPVVTLRAGRTWSNISRFDSRTMGVEVAWRSSF